MHVGVSNARRTLCLTFQTRSEWPLYLTAPASNDLSRDRTSPRAGLAVNDVCFESVRVQAIKCLELGCPRPRSIGSPERSAHRHEGHGLGKPTRPYEAVKDPMKGGGK